MLTEEKPRITPIDFKAIKISIASPDDILSWSHGEVSKPETINYRTQKPEKDGLFDERIFGPTKDYECYCGKYKKIRYKGIVCDKCGVEVTKSIVRRERLGHIKLAAPVSHIWYLRGTPSRLGLLLNLSVRDLERVIYFAGYIIKKVHEDIRSQTLEQLSAEFTVMISKIDQETNQALEKVGEGDSEKNEKLKVKAQAEGLKRKEEIKNAFNQAKHEIESLASLQILSDNKYRDISIKYGQIVDVGIGAEAVSDLLSIINIEDEIEKMRLELATAIGQRYKRITKRLRLFEGLKKAGIRPEWMIITVLPVIPPDLRPMVQLDGGRFATSDLNDLYRRVINRNNRLKRLLELGAPEVITRNEKRMLQEAVDALIDNSARRGKAVQATNRRTLRSLSDMLRGKQGRFRQNLLGKRVDYSGRSVIVVGADLKLGQCGLPTVMALELFKPFVIAQLINQGYAHNIRSASRLIERRIDVVWDILEEVTKAHPVLLNRAPTLHRLGIQAFMPVLIGGKAIQIHPLVCTAFNADFDGDQMAVHVPLSTKAKEEAVSIMFSENNLLKPASGEPVVVPSLDIVVGCYYLTFMKEGALGEGKIFTSPDEAYLAYQEEHIHIQSKIKVRIINQGIIETTVGRLIFNGILPESLGFINKLITKKELKSLIALTYKLDGKEVTAHLVDKIKQLGFRYATSSGVTFSVDDINIPKSKQTIIHEGDEQTSEIEQQYHRGLITDYERYRKIIELWIGVKDRVAKAMVEEFDKNSPVYMMVNSGARGSMAQLIQMGGMKGNVVNPAGETIELPIKANYKEGLSVLQYFISTHAARKGRSDTALRTSDAGYLTRRLVDVSQDMIVREDDCKVKEGIIIYRAESEEMGVSFFERINGRVALKDIVGPNGIIVKKNNIIYEDKAKIISNSDISEVSLRSVMSCQTIFGICKKCYGVDLATGKEVELGVAIGIMAAQAIGEPGTQLTMRTFHIGGVAGGADITQGLPRVEELFEARTPKYPALLSDIDGIVSIEAKPDRYVIRVTSTKPITDVYLIKENFNVLVKDGDSVNAKQALAVMLSGKKELKAIEKGIVKLEDGKIIITREEKIRRDYPVSRYAILLVNDKDEVQKGTQLTEGQLDVKKLLKLVGREAVQKYIIKEVQQIYASQGQVINDKHIEVIVRQMLSKMRIKDPGGSDLLPSELIERLKLNRMNEQLKIENKKPIITEELILGITKVSLKTDSFLSAASFQETTGVLIEAATLGATDILRGLKENVIIGKIIPAGTGFKDESK